MSCFKLKYMGLFNLFQGAVDVKLTEEEVKELESPYTPQPIFGPF